MPAITRDSLLTLEAYARERKAFRARVLSHKRDRTVHVGEHVTLLFEDELTIRYQIQEMLRIEKTFEEAGIQDELDVYNPLVPDGRNLKATMLIEYEDVDERRDALARLRGIEDAVYVCVEGTLHVRNHLAVRAILRERDDLRDRYGAVKIDLASDPAMQMGTYLARKSPVLQEVLALSALTDAEKRAILDLNTSLQSPGPPSDEPQRAATAGCRCSDERATTA